MKTHRIDDVVHITGGTGCLAEGIIGSMQKLIGGYKKTGVFISKEDMDQLIEVIAKAKAKDNFMRKTKKVATMGGTTGPGRASIGQVSIELFCMKLAKAYGLPDGKKYGVNKHREILQWLSISDLAEETKL
jgi:hypothetical protein